MRTDLGRLVGGRVRARPGTPPEHQPTYCGELELSDPRPTGPDDPRYGDARMLIRLHGDPVGFLEAPLRQGRLDVDSLVARATREFADRIAAHLVADGVAWERRPGATIPPRSPGCALAATDDTKVTVVVCTRDRGEMLRATLRSLAGLTWPAVEVVIVDNASRDDATKRAFFAEVGDDHRFRYMREDRPGLSVARNRGLAEARTDIVAYTDDDVRVDPEWLHGLVRGFARRPGVACVTGLVATAALESAPERYFDARLDWAASCQPELWHLTERPSGKPSFPFTAGVFGTGANFAVRADVMRQLNGFDEALGAGTPPGGGEDLDAFARIVLAGHWLAYEPSAIVWHTHRTTMASLRRQMYHYGTGMTAHLTKHLFDPAHRGAVARLVPRGILMSRKVTTSTRGAAGVSTTELRWPLIAVEFVGFAMGPLTYLRSRRERPPRSWDQIAAAAAAVGRHGG